MQQNLRKSCTRFEMFPSIRPGPMPAGRTSTEKLSLCSSRILPRKVRKGTRSCWECKRRKVQCRPLLGTDTVCTNCKRRGTPCVGQEFPNELHCEGEDIQYVSRVEYLEGLVGTLSDSVEVLKRTRNTSIDGSSGTGTETDSPVVQATPTRECLSKALIDAWPSEDHMKVILDLPNDSLTFFHGTLCGPLTVDLFNKVNNLHWIFRLPSIEAHPILLARPLLLLAGYLHSLPPSNVTMLRSYGMDSAAMSNHLFEVVRRNILSDESLFGSVESIECMMIAGMHFHDIGDLSSAWHCISRAVLLARIMSLDDANASGRAQYLLTETRERMAPDSVWIQLIQMNTYFSLILGLPSQTTCNDLLLFTQRLGQSCPIERMRYLSFIAGSRFLNGFKSASLEWGYVIATDQILKDSEACMPLSWWSIPDLEACENDKMELLQQVLRTMNQLAHFHLTTLLFLPHALSPGNHEMMVCSRQKILDASRETLLRYVALGGIYSVSSFCRGVSCLAYGACISLCVLHTLDRCQTHQANETNGSSKNSLSDRDFVIMRFALAVMQRLGTLCGDKIAADLVQSLKQLLDTQFEVVRVVSIQETTFAFPTPFGWGGCSTHDATSLYIRTPYIGIIEFTKQ